uniref:Phytocyanin domain-containing protein n=1 Tax=Nelumbo nucifera TaxID=4432 RepID=A0A822XT04_NELNU|nr:TPA_asm: hypothetical protein HUJ06_024993 [Nelumbo nucifera]
MAEVMRSSFMLMLLMIIISVIVGEKRIAAQVHHVVGDDHGWDPSSNIGAWSSGRIFRVGDKIWFAYSVAQESIAELKSKEEFDSCDTSNPIRMYTDGLDSISFDAEGTHYFTSGRPESCKKGLKFNVEVLPQPKTKEEAMMIVSTDDAVATGPTPSASTRGLPSSLWER